MKPTIVVTSLLARGCEQRFKPTVCDVDGEISRALRIVGKAAEHGFGTTQNSDAFALAPFDALGNEKRAPPWSRRTEEEPDRRQPSSEASGQIAAQAPRYAE